MMPEVAKATPINLDGTTLTAADLDAADTFRESFSSDDDEETGLPNVSVAAAESSGKVRGRSRVRWIVGGATAFLLIAGVSVGLATKSKDDTAVVKGSAAAEPPAAIDAPAVVRAEESGSSGDSALLIWSEDFTAASSAKAQAAAARSGSSPTTSLAPDSTSEPTKEPTPAPTSTPTLEPTASPTVSPTTSKPTQDPTPSNRYFMGDEFYIHSDGCATIDVSKGLTVRLIAQTGEKVQYANGDESKDRWHTKTDAAGIVSMNPEDPLNSGYAYLSNSEEGDGKGGVYGLYLDRDGNILEYKPLLEGTTDNCGGGLTPWNTFVSCEEYSDGQCWQIDAVTGKAEETRLGGDGGRYESVAVDNRDVEHPVFFTTEDDEEGALRRFAADGSGWDALHYGGETTYLEILDDKTFRWTHSLSDGRDSAMAYFPNTEGVQVHEGKVYFMAKKLRKMLILDLDTETYITETTGLKFYGEGDFGDQPDQNLFGPTRKYLYFTEDGGKNPGVYARYGTDETYFTMFQGNLDVEDETVGIALSPDHTAFYAGLQDHGCVYEFRREDGQPFE